MGHGDFGIDRTEVEYAIEDALEHARSCGDDRTAWELESILDGMVQARAESGRVWLH